MMTLSMTHSDPDVLAAMMNAAAKILTEENSDGLPQLGGQDAQLVQLDEPIVNRISGSIGDQLELPLRVIIALGAGLGLAFLVDYLDPTVRDRAELESIGFSVMAEIPKR
jgi:hypothetical protein